MKRAKKDPNVYPEGYDAARIEKIIAFYDKQRGKDLSTRPDHKVVRRKRRLPIRAVWLEVPDALVPKVEQLIKRYRKTA